MSSDVSVPDYYSCSRRIIPLWQALLNRKRWIMGTIQPELFYIPWKNQKEKKSIYIHPLTQLNYKNSSYYPIADISYRRISYSKYMILNENKKCLNTNGETVESNFISQGVQNYMLSIGKYYYYEIVAAIGDKLIEKPVEFIVTNDTKDSTEYYFDHDYRAIKMYYECVTEDISPNIKMETGWFTDTSPKFNYSVTDNTTIMPPTVSYIIYTKVKSIEFEETDYTYILQEAEPLKDPQPNEGSFKMIYSGVDPNSGWHLLGTHYTLYEVHPKYLISGYKFDLPEFGMAYKFYPSDVKHLYNTRGWDLSKSSSLSNGSFSQVDCVREYCPLGDEGFPSRRSIVIDKPQFTAFIKTTYKNGFEFVIEKHYPEHQVTDMTFSISEDGSTNKTEDNSYILEEVNYPVFYSTFFRSNGINKNSDFIREITRKILQKPITTYCFIRIYEKNKKEYQTSVIFPYGNTLTELSGVSDDEITDCYDIVLITTQQARAGYEEYLD